MRFDVSYHLQVTTEEVVLIRVTQVKNFDKYIQLSRGQKFFRAWREFNKFLFFTISRV